MLAVSMCIAHYLSHRPFAGGGMATISMVAPSDCVWHARNEASWRLSQPRASVRGRRICTAPRPHLDTQTQIRTVPLTNVACSRDSAARTWIRTTRRPSSRVRNRDSSCARPPRVPAYRAGERQLEGAFRQADSATTAVGFYPASISLIPATNSSHVVAGPQRTTACPSVRRP